MSNGKKSGESTGKRITKTKDSNAYPPDLHIAISNDLTDDEMADAMIEELEKYWKQTEKLNAKRKR